MTKDEKRPSDYEPTLLDVLEAVQTGFNRHEKILTTLVEGQQNLREILNERTETLNQRVGNTQNRVEDIVDMLEKAKKTGGVFDFSLIQHTYDDK